MDYLDYIIIFALGLYIGFKVNEAIMRLTFKQMLEDAGVTRNDLEKFQDHWGKKLQEEADGLEHIDIKVEAHSGQLYAFRKDNNEFLGQGASRDDLIARLAEKMKGVRLVIQEGEGAELIKE
jgi:hypothetical protein